MFLLQCYRYIAKTFPSSVGSWTFFIQYILQICFPYFLICSFCFSRQGHLGSVTLLMQYGADPSHWDAEGCACIHVAAQFGHTSIVAYLIAKGTSPNVQDKHGLTPLMWSCQKVTRFLIQTIVLSGISQYSPIYLPGEKTITSDVLQ